MEVFLASENPQCKEALAFQKPLPPSLLCEYEPRFLQSSFWARFKSAQGWVPLRLWGEEQVSFIVSVLLRKISIPLLGTYTLAYVPMGVDFNDKESELLKDPKKYGDFLPLFEGEKAPGFVEAFWCGDPECEAEVKADTKATVRCLPFGRQENVSGRCFHCGKEARHFAVFAKSY